MKIADGREDPPDTHRERSRGGGSNGGSEVRLRERGVFRFLRAEDVPPEQFALHAVLHRSIFGFHSLANFCASAIWSGVIIEATRSLALSVAFCSAFHSGGNREIERLYHMCARM